MTDAEISEAKRSTTTGPADSETRKKVFIACIHRPGFDRCVPNDLISEKIDVGRGNWRGMSEYNLQRNWPLLKIIGCFESERDARAAVDVSFCAMKTEGAICPRERLYKMRQEYYPFIACESDGYDSEDINDDDDTSGDEQMPFETACELVELGPPTLWSIIPFDMNLTQWALSEVFVASGQYNASCCCAGSDEHIHIIGVFQGSAEARTAVDSKKKEREAWFLHIDDKDNDDVPPLSPKKFPSTLLIPDKDIAENWHEDGTGCIAFQVRDYDAHSDCGIDRVSLRVQKVSNVPASKPLKLLASVKSFLDMLVWLQLCNPKANALFSFVRLPTPIRSPFACTRVYGMLTHAERLRTVGCGFKGEIVRLLSLGMGRHCEPQRNSGASHKMMLGIARRVAAGPAAPVNSKPQSKKRVRRE
jgi:hypothetical protein